jgi:hypothetical protein
MVERGSLPKGGYLPQPPDNKNKPRYDAPNFIIFAFKFVIIEKSRLRQNARRQQNERD